MKRTAHGQFGCTKIDYCNVCNKSWSLRKFKYLIKQFDEMNPKRPRVKGSKVSLSDEQRSWLLVHYFDRNGLVSLCKAHLKEFAYIGNNVYQQLMVSAKRPADHERPLYDLPDPLTLGTRATEYRYHPITNPNESLPKQFNPANKKSSATIIAMQKFFKVNTHPLPDKAPIRIFFADIPSYRVLYKSHYKKAHAKGTSHYMAWSTWNFYRRTKFPWVKVIFF